MAEIFTLLDDVDGANNGTMISQYGGPHSVHVKADTWAGGAVTIQASCDGGTTWMTMTHFADDHDARYTEDGANFLSPAGQGAMIRAISTGVSLVGCTVRLLRAPLA